MLEFSSIGNIDKMLSDNYTDVYLPFNLRLLYALIPYLSSHTQSKASSTIKASEDKSIERLFNLYDFTEKKIQKFEYSDKDLYENESMDIFTLCDADVSQKKWISRLFRVTVIIIEALFAKGYLRSVDDFIQKSLQKFPDNGLLYAYAARINQTKGDFISARILFDKISSNLPHGEFLDFIAFNNFLQFAGELQYQEAKTLLKEIAHKYPQYSTLAYNNLAFIHIAEGEIKEAIEILENTIRTEPWNINEPLVSNLLHLYDFYYIDTKDKKKIILEIIDRYATDINRQHIVNEFKL